MSDDLLYYSDVPNHVSNLADRIKRRIENHFTFRKNLFPFELRMIELSVNLYQAEFRSAINGIGCSCDLEFHQSNQKNEKLTAYFDHHVSDCIKKIDGQLNHSR